MGTTDFGTQTLSFDYNQNAEAKLFNTINYKLTPTGIYSGFTLSKLSESAVSISSGICFIEDDTNKVGTRIVTESAQTITVNNSIPYLVLRFSWTDAQNNYMDMLAVEYAAIQTNDLIIGRCVYNDAGTELQTTFDYTRRSNFYTNKLKTEQSYLRVYATEPASNKVEVTAGVLNSSKGNLVISGGNYPSAGLASTTNGRIDLIYIDENGDVQFILGNDSSTPVAPRYGNRKVIAEIRRGSGRANIKGTDIFRVISSFDANAITSDTLLVDSGSNYSATNVEDAFAELAASNFTFKGIKTFNDEVIITGGTGKVALTVKGASGQNIVNFKSSDNTPRAYIDQNGKLVANARADISLLDSYTLFTTDKYEEAINQMGGLAFTFKGIKTFNEAPSFVKTGVSPFNVTSTVVVSNLNADRVDNYHVSTSASSGTIPVQGSPAIFTTLNASSLVSSSTVQGTILISTIATGTAPLTVTSTTKVANLNADLLDGYNASTSATSGTIPIQGNLVTFTTITATSTIQATGTITSSSTVQGTRLISTVATGTTPLTVTSTTLVSNLNADRVDNYHVAPSAAIGTIPVQGNPATFTTLTTTSTIVSQSTIQGTRLISTIATGTAPLTVTSATQVTNLNSQFVGGKSPSETIPSLTTDKSKLVVHNCPARLTSLTLDNLSISSTSVVTNLNADRVDNYHVSSTYVNNTIPVQGSGPSAIAKFGDLQAFYALTLPIGEPSVLENGYIWVEN